jgi:hypothetical protein
VLARRLIELGASFAVGRAGTIVVARGSDELFELALVHGLPLDGPGANAVLDAGISRGHVARVARLIEAGAALGALPHPLHAALRTPPGEADVAPTARAAMLDLLLLHGVPLDARGTSALSWAILGGDAASALQLLERGASVASGVELAEAFRRGMTSLARRLHERGAPRTTPTTEDWWVEELVGPDLVTPAALEVRYRASAEPQRVRVEAEFVKLGATQWNDARCSANTRASCLGSRASGSWVGGARTAYERPASS